MAETEPDYSPGTSLEQKYIDELMPTVMQWRKEIENLLPNIPEVTKIHWFSDGPWLIPEQGTGGFAWADHEISLWFDPDFKDKKQQLKDLRGVYYHESFHIAQGWVQMTDRWIGITATGHAIMEGAATVFARQYGDYGPDYSIYSEDQSKTWLEGTKK